MPSPATRALPVLLAAAVFTAACSSPADQPSAAQAPASTATSPPAVATVDANPERARYAYGFTSQQQDFLKALAKYPKYANADDAKKVNLIEAAKDFCGQGDIDDSAYVNYGGHPPNVDGIIENKKYIGPLERAAVRYLCPRYSKVLRRGLTGFTEGERNVGADVKPGTYRTTERGVRGCYWERATASGDIIANDHVTYAREGVTVTIRPGDGAFISRGCGNWAPPS